MYLRFFSLTWNGSVEYNFHMHKDSTVVDCFCAGSMFKLAVLDEQQYPLDSEKKNRKFKVIGDWDDGILMSDEMAFIGTVQWLPILVPTVIHAQLGPVSYDIPTLAPGTTFFPEIETYMVFEVMNAF